MLLEITKNFRWIGDIQNIIKDYNNNIHRTIQIKPVEVNKKN